MDIQIKKFKKIDDASIHLKSLNVFIGANNSGKSSFIQGIQFAISGCQTLTLAAAPWSRKTSKTASLDSSEFLYTPTENIAHLYHGRKLTGARTRDDRAWMEFVFSNGHSSTLKISKGKNGGFTTTLAGKVLGEELSDIVRPYCVYVPGIAGIPTKEKREAPITIKKSATRGDSNNYLRNILYEISSEKDTWEAFHASVNRIYKDITVSVIFDGDKSEYINVSVADGGHMLPLDSVGTGLLQVIQIFAYIEYFNPKIILLDEPDSHIHPTKQKMLADELALKATNNAELKIVFSTHSRYMLESLEHRANVIHFQNGKALQDVQESKILIDIGAADADHLFSKKSLKYIVVTEDSVDDIEEKKEYLKNFLLANGLAEDEFVMHSYEGCTKVDFARILKGFVRKQIPTAEVILHIDRDQKIDSDRELVKLKDDCERKNIHLFVTKYQEIESYYCTPLHLNKVYGLPFEQANEIYAGLIADLEEVTRNKLTNFILRERKELSVNSKNMADIVRIKEIVDDWYTSYGEFLTPGKELLGKTKAYLQEKLKLDPNMLIKQSEALRDPAFCDLLAR